MSERIDHHVKNFDVGPRRACSRQQIAELTFHLLLSSAQAAQAGAITGNDRALVLFMTFHELHQQTKQR